MFKVGDIVEAFGLIGTVVSVKHSGFYSVSVEYDLDGSFNVDHFTPDGRCHLAHKTPSLKLVERPKKTTKKIVEGWVNLYTVGWGCVHTLEADARARGNSPNFIATAKVTGEYEIEEDANE